MDDRPLTETWVASDRQFADLKTFVTVSASNRPSGDQAYRESLYCSWVLLTYAALQGAINDQGSACMKVLGRAAQFPADLPTPVLKEHNRQTLTYLADYANGRLTGRVTEEMFGSTLSSIERDDWSEHSRLMTFDRNVWPDYVKSWLGRLGSHHDLGWIDAPVGGESETLGSQIKRLVDERNRFAHGERPTITLESQLMCEWIDAARLFAERVLRTLQEWVVRTFAHILFPPIGEVDDAVSAALGASTVAFSKMRTPLAVGEVVCARDRGTPTLLRVVSMQRDDVALADVAENVDRVAITFSRPVANGAQVHCLP